MKPYLLAVYTYILRFLCTVYYWLLSIACYFRKSRVPRREKIEILITGTFYSDNWLITHLKPLAMSKEVAVIKMVSTRVVPEIEGVVPVYPPALLIKAVGEVPARLLLYSYIAIKEKPDLLGGFHILINGLLAILLARIIGRNSLYICGGGEREVEGGGYNTESKIFNKLSTPDKYIENILLKSVNHASLIISMGSGAKAYFKEKGIRQRIEVIPGGFDSGLFVKATDKNKDYDLIIIGRLSKVKRIDVFLRAVQLLVQRDNAVSAVIVGDGPDMQILQQLAQELEISTSIHFAGWQNDVAQWLKKSKIFVMTSESEGLSQALIQAMMTGLPAVVSNVGDLSDLVVQNRNGMLIDELDPKYFADAIHSLLSDQSKYELFSRNAEIDTSEFSYNEVAKKWDCVLGESELFSQ